MTTCSFKKCFNFDKKLQLPRNFIYVGATQSGKTQLFLKTLENAAENYSPPPKNVYFLFNSFQNLYLEIQDSLHQQGIAVNFVQASDFSEKDMETISDPNGGQTLIVIDDATMATTKSKNMAHLFTVARHKNCSIVVMWHVLFAGTQESHIISQNTQYYFLLSSPRMQQQIANLGSQVNMRKTLVSAYGNATDELYGYVLLDLNVGTPAFLRTRSHIFGCVQRVYIPSL